MNKHTPGPWKIATGLSGMILAPSRRQEGFFEEIVQVPYGLRELNWKANAQLIAAAPELLEACYTAANVLREDVIKSNNSIEALKILAAVIAKAEGDL